MAVSQLHNRIQRLFQLQQKSAAELVREVKLLNDTGTGDIALSVVFDRASESSYVVPTNAQVIVSKMIPDTRGLREVVETADINYTQFRGVVKEILMDLLDIAGNAE